MACGSLNLADGFLKSPTVSVSVAVKPRGFSRVTGYFSETAIVYLDLPNMYNFCLLVGLLGKKAQILHTWKIQVYLWT